MNANDSSPSRSAIESAVVGAYAKSDVPLDNDCLYAEVADTLGVQMELFTQPDVRCRGSKHSSNTRHARWTQQTLKMHGLIERVERARWRLTAHGRRKLRRPVSGMHLLAFSTHLGLAVWGDCRDIIAGLDESITLCLTSPCYPIAKGRDYGRISESTYVDWLCAVLEGVVARLAPGGNLALILGNDVFMPGSPTRSTYIEGLTLALTDRFGLWLMDRLVWHNASKAPGPVRWASIERSQLNTAYEHVLWLTNDTTRVIADNRRVLQPHTKRQRRLLATGGEQPGSGPVARSQATHRGASHEMCSLSGTAVLTNGPTRRTRNAWVCRSTAHPHPFRSHGFSCVISRARGTSQSVRWPGRRAWVWRRNSKADAGWRASNTVSICAAVPSGLYMPPDIG